MGRAGLALLLAALLVAPAASAGDGPRALLLRGGLVELDPSADAVLVEDGRIAAVGRYVDGYVGDHPVPPDAETIHVRGAGIWPGFLDAGTLLAGAAAADEAVTADVRAADGFDPFADRSRILATGVTAVAVDPGRGRLVPGLSAVVRLGGGDPGSRVIRAEAALHVVLTAAALNPPYVYVPPVAPAEGSEPLEPAVPQLPTTLAGAVLRLREVFALARGEGTPTEDDPEPLGLSVVARALAGEIPIVIHADRADEIRAALRIVAENRGRGPRFVLAGGEEATELAREIAEAGVPVILDGGFVPGGMPVGASPEEVERRERALGAAAALRKHGGRVAFRSSGDPADLFFLASRFVRPGFSFLDLLKALTSDAAEILGVADRVGSVAVGKDADLLLTAPDGGEVVAVVAGGEVVYRRSPDEDLLVVEGERIYADEGVILPDSGVLVSRSRILEVGTVARPEGARVVRGPVVVPGFIDAHGWLGLVDPGARAAPPPQLPPSVPMARALSPGNPAFVPVARAGVTTFLAAPPGGGLVAGTASVAHTAGRTRDELVLADSAAVVFTVTGSRDLAATMEQLSGVLGQAKSYADSHTAHTAARRDYDAWVAAGRPGDKREEPKAPGTDPNREPLRDVLEGRIPALVRARSAVEVREVLGLFVRTYGLRPLLVGAEDALAMAREIADAGCAVVLGPALVTGGPDAPVNLAAGFTRAGVPVLFGSSGTTGAAWLPATVSHAVNRGLGAGAALAGLTWTAADRLGVGDRTGRIAPGRTADLLVLSGPPFRAGTRVLAVVRGGRVVYEEKGDSR